MRPVGKWRWWSLALRGLAAIALGIISFFVPTATFVSLVIVFGVYAIVDGALALASGSRVKQGWIVARGLVSIIAGVLALIWPGITALVLLLVIASWGVVAGLFEIIMAIRNRKELEHEWLLVLEGGISIAFGVLLFVSPLAGAITLGLWIGAYALVYGVLLLAASWRVRRRERTAPSVGFHQPGSESLA